MKLLKKQKLRKQFSQLPVAAGVLISRLGALPYNFSPLGNFGFFGGNLLQFAAVILLFDVFWGGFYRGHWFTYVGFLAYWVFGRLAKGSTKKQVLLLPIASFVFFLLSNLGVWWFWFPKTLEGLIACYIAALPFYRNTILGDLIFGYGYLAVKALVGANAEPVDNLQEKVGLASER